MKNKKQEAVCSFTVVDNSQTAKQIIVCQDKITYYGRDEDHKKTFHLEAIDGPEVFRTSNPNIFKLKNGELLRKRSH